MEKLYFYWNNYNEGENTAFTRYVTSKEYGCTKFYLELTE